MINPTSLRSFMIPLVIIGLLQACSRDENKTQEAQQGLVASVRGTTTFMGVATLEKNNEVPQASMSRASVSDTHSQAKNSAQSFENDIDTHPNRLLEELLWMSSTGDPEYAESIRAILHLLRNQGHDAFRAVREFLLSSKPDPNGLPFDAWELELRQALLDVLLSFDMPEVEGFAYDLLKQQPGPIEVWQLGRYLEGVSPGSYTNEIRNAAEFALQSTDASQEVPGQLFQILGEAGNSATVRLLADRPVHQSAYASVALALIPDGSGVPLLEQDARLFESGKFTLQGRIAIELLAQQAYRDPGAAQVIIDLAKQNLIPADIWHHVLALVAGSEEVTLAPPGYGRRDTHTIYRPEGDQTLYRVARSPMHDSFEQSSLRLSLLGELQQIKIQKPDPNGS